MDDAGDGRVDFDASTLLGGEKRDDASLYLIFLNRPFECDSVFRHLWQKASYRVCADGGANRLYEAINKSNSPVDQFVPEAIVGDLDSIKPSVQTFYENLGCQIIHDSDQYSTDFGKCIVYIRSAAKREVDNERKSPDILIYGSLSGRVDQGLGILGELLRETTRSQGRLRLWLLSESGLSWILPAGTSTLHGLKDMDMQKEPIFTPNVGILPIYGSSNITTKGLEWDVTLWHTQMGGNVSSSNHVVADEVTISTTAQVLFTVERTKAET